MDNRELLAYKNRLLDAGIGWRQVRRNLREVKDHYQDLEQQARDGGLEASAAQQRAREQIGDLDQLADAMIAGNARSLLHRHPVAMTVVLPFMAYIAACILLVLGLIFVVDLLELKSAAENGAMPAWISAFFDAALFTQTWLFTPLLASMLIVFSLRNRVLPRFWLPGLLLLCILGSGSTMVASIPDPATGSEGMLGLSFGYALLNFGHIGMEGNNLRLLLNLLLCGSFVPLYQWLQNKNVHVVNMNIG